MFDLAAVLATRADLADELTFADADADRAYESYCDGTGDFGDRCYFGDRAYDARARLEAYDLGACALILAMEA
jgi:hypothetical protein